MKDNIFKPLTHLDREGPDANNDRFQRRDNTNFHDDVFQNMDTNPTHPQEGWDGDEKPADNPVDALNEDRMEANGCYCPAAPDGVDVYQETVIVEFYDDVNDKQ